jgi:hypothetical protein
MGAYSGPEIVNDGLVLHLDAANERSYSGSGTTWGDISNNNINFTLVGNPSYNASGYFTFNGIDQYATTSVLAHYPDNNNSSFSIWFRPVSTPAGNRPIWSDNYGPELGVWIDQNNLVRTFVYSGSTGATVPNGTWVNIVFTFFSPAANSGLSYQHSTYVNGELIQANRTGTVGNGLNDTPIQIGRDHGNLLYSNADVSVFSQYNRRLTDAEVRQNYEAFKGRYSI